MKAASIGRLEMCQVLVENGVDPTMEYRRSSMYYYAKKMKRKEIKRYLKDEIKQRRG